LFPYDLTEFLATLSPFVPLPHPYIRTFVQGAEYSVLRRPSSSALSARPTCCLHINSSWPTPQPSAKHLAFFPLSYPGPPLTQLQLSTLRSFIPQLDSTTKTEEIEFIDGSRFFHSLKSADRHKATFPDETDIQKTGGFRQPSTELPRLAPPRHAKRRT
jgi:hypothetical protein